MKKAVSAAAVSWIKICVGLLLATLAYRLFLIPNEIAPGGFTGVGQIFNALFGWQVGIVALALNVPLFLLSLKSIGLKFGFRSLVASVALSLLIDYLPVGALTQDKLMAAIFGGVLGGIGFGLIMRGDATTGGTDMLASVVNRRVPALKVSILMFAVDGLIILAAGVVFDATSAMLALVSAYVMSRLIDLVLEGANMAKAYFIISDRAEEISRRVLEEMERGVTGLDGRGMYTGEDRQVLLCVINRRETMKLRNIVSSLDPGAFMIATDVREALGEGFQPHVQ